MDDQSLQTLLTETGADLGIVGAQLALFDGRELRQFATGSRDKELGLPVTVDTLFQIGSTTKVFNAATLMTLVDAGQLDLDAPVKDYIVPFRLADAKAEDAITLRHLLSMTSGLDNGPYYDFGRGDDALGRYVEALSGIPQVFSPGTAFGYSNASTNVSGHAAARVTGRSWESLVTTRLLGPLSLHHSGLFAEDLLAHPVALGYVHIPGKTEPERRGGWSYPRSIAPAGGTLTCSAGDLVRLARMFLDGGKSPDGQTVLSPAAVAAMHQPQITLPCRFTAEKWCLGPYWKQWGGYAIYGHSGTNLGGSSMLLWCPEKNVAIATVVNVAKQGYPLADRIFDVVFPQLFGVDKPKDLKPADIVPAAVDLDRYVGRYEAYGNTIYFTKKGGKLFAAAHQSHTDPGGEPALTSELIAIGDDRFVPLDLAFSGNRSWDVGFWGKSDDGRPTHFLNGAFALRRTD